MATAEVKIKVTADTVAAQTQFQRLGRQIDGNAKSFGDLQNHVGRNDAAIKKLGETSDYVTKATGAMTLSNEKAKSAMENFGKIIGGTGNAASSFLGIMKALPGPLGLVATGLGVAIVQLDLFTVSSVKANQAQEMLYQSMLRRDKKHAEWQNWLRTQGPQDEGEASPEDIAAERERSQRVTREWKEKNAPKTPSRMRGGSGREVWTDTTPSQGWTPWADMVGGYLDKQSQPGWGAGLGGTIEGYLGAAGGALAGLGDQARQAQAGGDASRQAQASEKFLADLQDQTQATGAAFSALSSGMAASVEAAITGSQSIGQAFKNAAAAALKATAVESTIKALYHTAAGVGSLALGPIGGVSAAGHFKAAGLYAATALAAGAASAGLGGGGGGGGYAGAGASGGGGYSRPAAQRDDGNAPINVYIGHGFVGDEKKLGSEIHRAVRTAKRSGGARDSAAIGHD